MPKCCNSIDCQNPRFSKGFCSYHQNERTDEKWLNKKSKSGIKKKSFNPISKKMADELAIYRVARDKYMDEHEICEYEGCSALANDLHHENGRGINLYNVDYFMAVCRSHHNYIHEHPKDSREKGYLI